MATPKAIVSVDLLPTSSIDKCPTHIHNREARTQKESQNQFPNQGQSNALTRLTNPTCSFAEALLGKEVPQASVPAQINSSEFDYADLKTPTSILGSPAILFDLTEKASMVSKYQYTLIGKFSHGKPTWKKLTDFFNHLNLKSECKVSIFDHKHLYIVCSNRTDFYRLWLRLVWNVDGFPMRVFRWESQFNALKESSIAPVWIRFEGLPLYMFDQMSLLNLSNAIGRPICIDNRNLNGTMLNSARVCVELDVSKPLIDLIKVGFEQSGSKVIVEEILVKVFYDVVPSFCCSCWHIGHSKAGCKRSNALSGPNPNQRPGKEVAATVLDATKLERGNGASSRRSRSRIRKTWIPKEAANLVDCVQSVQVTNREAANLVDSVQVANSEAANLVQSAQVTAANLVDSVQVTNREDREAANLVQSAQVTNREAANLVCLQSVQVTNRFAALDDSSQLPQGVNRSQQLARVEADQPAINLENITAISTSTIDSDLLDGTLNLESSTSLANHKLQQGRSDLAAEPTDLKQNLNQSSTSGQLEVQNRFDGLLLEDSDVAAPFSRWEGLAADQNNKAIVLAVLPVLAEVPNNEGEPFQADETGTHRGQKEVPAVSSVGQERKVPIYHTSSSTWADQAETEDEIADEQEREPQHNGLAFKLKDIHTAQKVRYIDFEKIDVFDDIIAPSKPGSVPSSPRFKLSTRAPALDDLALIHSKDDSEHSSPHKFDEYPDDWGADNMEMEPTLSFHNRYNFRVRKSSRKGFKYRG